MQQGYPGDPMGKLGVFTTTRAANRHINDHGLVAVGRVVTLRTDTNNWFYAMASFGDLNGREHTVNIGNGPLKVGAAVRIEYCRYWPWRAYRRA